MAEQIWLLCSMQRLLAGTMLKRLELTTVEIARRPRGLVVKVIETSVEPEPRNAGHASRVAMSVAAELANIVVTVDTDCVPDPNWLAAHRTAFNRGVDAIDGPPGARKIETEGPQSWTCDPAAIKALSVSLGKQIEPHFPLLRRYAALLTGRYPAGDVLVRATLEAIVADPKRIDRGDVRGALYRVFQETAQASPEEDEDGRPPLHPAYEWLARLPPLVRKPTLLVSLVDSRRKRRAACSTSLFRHSTDLSGMPSRQREPRLG